MRKTVAVSQLTTGMYIHDLKCSWLNHPFARKRFLIEGRDTIKKIRQTGVSKVIIDTKLGGDIPSDEVTLRPKAAQEVTPLKAESTQVKPADQAATKPSIKEERQRAKKVQSEATQLISDMMSDVKLGKQIEVEQVSPVVNDLISSIFSNQDALMGLARVRHRDKYTFEHSLSVTVLLLTFAKSLELSAEVIHQIGIGGIVHDIGKTKTPDHILNKPGKLTDEEFVIMREHVVHSRTILEATPGISDIALAISAEHHERYDGTGYPLKLKGDEITFYGQMGAIVDVYDALTAERVYHKGISPQETLSRLVEAGGSHFNPELVKKFVHCVGIYPVGTLVRLKSERLAIIIGSGKKDMLHPIIRPVLDIKTRNYIDAPDIDLSETDEDSIVSSEAEENWNISPESYMD